MRRQNYEAHDDSQTQQYNDLQDEIQDINYKLAELPHFTPGQRGYTRKYMLLKINQKFDELKVELRERGHTFKFSENVREYFLYASQGHDHQIKRVLKLRFKCKNNRCPEFVRDQDQEKQRNWTTYYGLTCFEMYFDKKQVLRYYFKIYGQKCYTCREYGSGMVIHNTMRNMLELYCLVIKEIFLLSPSLSSGIELSATQKYGTPPLPSRFKRRKDRTLKHRQDLCEACQQGQCVYFFRYKKVKEQQSDNEFDFMKQQVKQQYNN